MTCKARQRSSSFLSSSYPKFDPSSMVYTTPGWIKAWLALSTVIVLWGESLPAVLV